MSEETGAASARDDINGLRAILFETMRGVRAGTVDAVQAKAMISAAHAILGTARVEIDYLRATDAEVRSTFIAPALETQKHPLPPGITAVHQHRLRG